MRVRRGYFDCRYGQLHVHSAMPAGGGFEEGTPLLCVHDLPGRGSTFTRFLALAGGERSVYAPDLPGFGESDGPTVRSEIADFAAAVADFIDCLHLRQLAVLGLRSGALLATELARLRPGEVSRVILVSVPPLTQAERVRARGQLPPAAPQGTSAPECLSWAIEAAARYPLRERLAKLPQRVLVLRPRDDLWEATGRAREALPSARLLELELSGFDLFACAPRRVAEAVREFLRV